MMKTIHLNKARSILQKAYSWYKSHHKTLSASTESDMREQLLGLERAIATKDRQIATQSAEQMNSFTQKYCKKSFFDYVKEIGVAILVALVLAIIVRQMWFEIYEIPTGSMRPTFREQDRVAVTKTAFGVNIPLSRGHLLFDSSLVQRGGAITFTSEGIDRLEEDVNFLGLIPYKKRLVKRLIGKPGDSLYFYGGKIYGVDKDGNPLKELLDATWMHTGSGFDIEYIPFMRPSGEIYPENAREVRFRQMNLPIGRLVVDGQKLKGEVFNGQTWVKEEPHEDGSNPTSPKNYSDFFGMRNYAMARLLTAKELQEIDGIDPQSIPEGVLYLELSHHPSLTYPLPLVSQNPHHPLQLSLLKSVIPLQQKDLDRIMDMMYTARLVFKNGRAARYNVDATRFDSTSPVFTGVPDGTYEFYQGKLTKLGFGGIEQTVSKDNPLYSHDPKNVEKLFNLGIEMHAAYVPSIKNLWNIPSRYAYFRNGDLYVLGGKLLTKDDPALTTFNEREAKQENLSSKEKPYTAFKDFGPPIKKNGEWDVNFIRTFGITVPANEYLMLGDNHAMSGDSRIFGMVPEKNLEGAPSLVLWPPGERMGMPWQAPYQIFVFPRLIIWATALALGLIWYLLHRRYLNRPIQF